MKDLNTPLIPINISHGTLAKIQKIKPPCESDDDFISRLVEKADDLIGIDEVASMLHLAKGTVCHLTSLHIIPFFKTGKYLLSRRSEITAYIAQNQSLSSNDVRHEAARLVSRD